MATPRDGQWLIGGYMIAPMPGCETNAPGTAFGVTTPYLKPWSIDMIHAANEPAKPPRQDVGISETMPFTAMRLPEGENHVE